MPEALPPHLMKEMERIRELAKGYGLDFFETIFQVLEHDELNMVAAYGGFPTRYPHWRFGMEYESLAKGYQWGLSKIYEMVINTDPSYAYLMKGNADVDQKLVMAHVYGHVDFFKNNVYFAHTNRKMVDEMANHATRVRRYIDRYGIETVENFIDACLSLENLIDRHSTGIKRRKDRNRTTAPDEEDERVPAKIKAKSYMDRYINPKEFLDAQQKKLEDERKRSRRFPEEPERDVLLFLLENAPLDHWEQDILEIIRDEAYYFSPQGMTKVMNEGWACIHPESFVFSGKFGLVRMRDVVENELDTVSDGVRARRVYGRNIIRDHATRKVRTRRGLVLEGSDNHRVLLADGETWKRLDELEPGSKITISGGGGLWPSEYVPVRWTPQPKMTLQDVAASAGVAVHAVADFMRGRNVAGSAAIAASLEPYYSIGAQSRRNKRAKTIQVPERVDERFGEFLGFLVGDGHISRVNRELGLVSADIEQIEQFARLVRELFGLFAAVKKDGGRYRATVYSQLLSDLLVDLGLTTGPSARKKQVPDAIRRSPKSVVRAFLRGLFDCDGYAGKQGVILSTSSDAMSEQVQLLLLNFGILSRRRKGADECWHVDVMGASAKVFLEEIGFGLLRKQEKLREYVASRCWFKKESWTDEIVSIEEGRADVYDISVDETHRYAAAGFINHNSYWHSTMMTRHILLPSEFIDYADHHSGTLATSPGRLNPYKLGIELFRDIEDRWNKGKFGKEYEECRDMVELKQWDRKLGLGREKIFEVRKIHNDVTFVDEFLTPEFAIEHKLFTFDYNKNTNTYEIRDREWQKVKNKLLFMLTNWGQPHIHVVDGNFENRGELLLQHRHEGVDLEGDYARDTLKALHTIWRRPVNLDTAWEGKRMLLTYDGREHKERELSQMQLL